MQTILSNLGIIVQRMSSNYVNIILIENSQVEINFDKLIVNLKIELNWSLKVEFGEIGVSHRFSSVFGDTKD